MKELSSIDKANRPYTLLLDAQLNRAAAYNATHRLITEDCSDSLLAYAQAHMSNSAPFDRDLHDPGLTEWRPLPAWATPEVQGRLVILWIARPNGDDPDEAWLAIPAR